MLNKINKSGQVFTFDFILGLFAFVALLVLGFTQLFSFLPSSDFETVYEDSVYVSSVLIEEGYPLNWTYDTVILPGIANNHKVNISKLQSYENISYDSSKLLFHINSEYLFFFKNQTNVLNLSSCVYGYPADVNESSCEVDLSLINYQDLAKTERLLAYNGTIITMVVYTWKN